MSFSANLERTLNPMLSTIGRYISMGTKRSLVEETLSLLRPFETSGELIRVGSEFDGGYLVPSGLPKARGLISPGVADDSSFELFYADSDVRCILVDASVSGPPISHKNFEFIKEWVGADTEPGFSIALGDLINSFGPTEPNSLILQMDIEGSEYEVLASVEREELAKFQLMVIELHGLENIANPFAHKVIDRTLKKLTFNHDPVHIHPNNCCGEFLYRGIKFPRVVEVTLVSKSLGITFDGFPNLPHPLDRPNLSNKKDIFFDWDF